MPVPTAVPPRAISERCFKLNSSALIPWSNCETYPENSWPRERGVASIKCVLPIFIMLLKSFDFFSKTFFKCLKPGSVE